ncbi:MAG: hypothetical protein KGJ65_13285 [Betaproteobacteria bacterium]|nr:hypothetical protein [Betaproteobacteria bacterium]MDE2124622.1 hypothetical protein [Betaproteobacteria bacterium]MDE2185811.1 hypothetical protein [Betaproteobacteria bacterium]
MQFAQPPRARFGEFKRESFRRAAVNSQDRQHRREPGVTRGNIERRQVAQVQAVDGLAHAVFPNMTG